MERARGIERNADEGIRIFSQFALFLARKLTDQKLVQARNLLRQRPERRGDGVDLDLFPRSRFSTTRPNPTQYSTTQHNTPTEDSTHGHTCHPDRVVLPAVLPNAF